MNLSADQLDTLRHMLGINTPDKRRPEPYRDYYCANPGDKDLHELTRLGAVEMYSKRDGYEWFQCTEAGRTAALASFRTIQYRKPQRIYSAFLDCRDCFADLTFHEFLTSPDYAKTRADA